MKRLKIILQSRWFYLIVIIFSLLFVHLYKYKSRYLIDTCYIEGIVDKYSIDGSKLSMEIKGIERISVSYYFSSLDEKNYYLDNLKLGIKIGVWGEIKEPKHNSNFNGFDYNDYLKSKKIYWVFSGSKINIVSNDINFLYRIKNFIRYRIDNSLCSDYLYAFVLGDSSIIDDEVKDSYRLNGISHLLSISGMHITLLFSSLLKVLDKIKKNRFNFWIVSVLLLLYLFLTGFSPSALRASLLFFLINLKNKNQLVIKTYYILILIFCILIIYNPYYIYNIGFNLSFIVSFYLLIYSDLINKYKGYFSKLFITSTVAFIAGLPFIISSYYSINILSIVLNLFFVPLVTYFIFPLSFFTIFIGYFGYILKVFVVILESASLLMSKYAIELVLRDIGYFVFVYVIVGIFVLYKLRDKKFYYLFLFIIMFIIHNNLVNFYPVLTMIDVGQGDSILIELPYDKGNVLIDTGGIMEYGEYWEKRNNPYSVSKSVIIPYLKSRGIKKIDYLIITHGDYDHIGGAYDLVNNYSVSNIILNSSHNNSNEEYLLKSVSIPYYLYNINNLKIHDYVLNFVNKGSNDENNDSLVIYVYLNSKLVLLTGDIGSIENELPLRKVDVLKVAHHGSKGSSSLNFMSLVKPYISLVSVGENNRFSHPHKEAVERIERFSDFTYYTSINGMIRLTFKEKIIVENVRS